MHVTVAKQDLLHWKYIGGGIPLFVVTPSEGAFLPPHTVVAFETPEGNPLPGHAVPIGVPITFNHFVVEQAVCTRKPSGLLVTRQVFVLTVPATTEQAPPQNPTA
jgi:hypothetical protein